MTTIPADYTGLPSTLPAPEDDGACDHLPGLAMPALRLPSTHGPVDLAALPPLSVLFFYPMTGKPGVALPDGWDAIPGARGCTPQNCTFRDHHAGFAALGAAVFAVSTQGPAYQAEMAERLHLPYPVISDERFALCEALRLPTFEAGGSGDQGMRLVRRLTLVVRGGRIAKAFYPVFPPDQSAEPVLAWLRQAAAGLRQAAAGLQENAR